MTRASESTALAETNPATKSAKAPALTIPGQITIGSIWFMKRVRSTASRVEANPKYVGKNTHASLAVWTAASRNSAREGDPGVIHGKA
jgi:hypothetical protein